MKKERRILLLIGTIIIFISTLVLAVRFWGQQCVERYQSYLENFDTEDFKDKQNTSVAEWPSGPIRLNYLGANFQVTEPAGMGAKIYVCDAGDFDGDGYPDLIGLDIANNYRLILVRNWFRDADGDGRDDDGIIFRIDPNEVYDDGLIVGPASITVADYNNDGLLDFFFYKNRDDSFSYNQFVAAMYINIGTKTDPNFMRYNQSPNLNFTARFQQAGIYCNWAADHLCSVDIDKDGDMDVLVISQDKIFLVRNPGPQNFNLNAFDIAELNYDQRTGFTVGRGGSSIDAADFDNDGDIDIVGGTVNNIAYLVYYENDGTGFFTRKTIPIPNPTCTGTVATCIADFKRDGWKDIFGATDRWNAGNEARMWLFKNNGLAGGSVNWAFRCLNHCDPILPPPHDVDMSACLDYDQDGDMDVILADANHSGDYYLIINELAPVYNLYGEARSTSITSDETNHPELYLDPNEYAITKVRVKSIRMGVRGGSNSGLKVTLYVSNDAGQTWETYARWEGNDLKNYNNLDWHTFNSFGSRLQWKAVLEATEDEMAEYEGASFETPLVHEIELEWTYVEKREYSRTSVVAANVQVGSQTKKLIIAGSFIYPGWHGQLRAYDVTNMQVQNTPNSVLRTVSTSSPGIPGGRDVASGVSIFWDAGELLRTRDHSDRTIYTSVRSNNTLSRIEFTAANVGVLGPYLQDFNNDNTGLINFIRGAGRPWKLGDINHSNPIVVGPPDGNPALMGSGYDNFMTTWANRRKVIYVGANDGMLHCFDVETGRELWGYIPFNLLPKLRNMWRVDSSDPENIFRYYQHDFYVDGTPIVADVYINNAWKTVLLCGQALGSGSSVGGGLNYYFALDVTDPENPQPLWEFTDSGLGETWSIPVVGRVMVNGVWSWVAFMGSGYDNNPSADCGNYFYAVNIADGTSFWSYAAGDVDTTLKFGLNIPNAIPASPSIVDINSDGRADRVYFADLDGRVYRLNCSIGYELKGKNNTWDSAVTRIYTDPMNYPILSKPVAYVNQLIGINTPRLYFGTGGDDRSPSLAVYSFVALNDEGGNTATVEWFIGDHNILGQPNFKDKGDLSTGEKVWADAVVSDNIVYFSTLTGSIESVDPCANLLGAGRLYARFILNIAGSPVGGGLGTSALMQSGSRVENLALASKSRAAVTLGERQRTDTGERKREVYIQEYDSTIQRLEQTVGALLKVKSWREVYKVIR